MTPRKGIEAAIWSENGEWDQVYRALVTNQTLILEVLLDIRDALMKPTEEAPEDRNA